MAIRKLSNITTVQKISSGLFAAVIGVILLATPTTIAMSKIAPETIPDTIHPANNFSYLEGRQYTYAPLPTKEGITTGMFQSDAESFVADNIPCRDTVLLVNASLQRHIIAGAAIPFGFDTLPSFFGSSYCLSENGKFYITAEALAPQEDSLKREETLAAAQAYANFAARHPENRCLIYHVAYPQMSLDNKTIALVENAWTSAGRKACFESVLGGGSNMTYTDNAALINDDYYLRTDHHWTLEGAYRTYCDLSQKLGFIPLDFKNSDLQTFATPFYGTLSRYALDDSIAPDFISDYSFNYPNYEITINGKSVSERTDKKGYRDGKVDPSQFADRHSEYFGASETEIIYENPQNPEGKTLLAVRDSYMSDIEPMLAYHYSTVYFLDLRNDDAPQLESYLSKHAVDDILFMGSDMLTWKNITANIDGKSN